MSGLRQLVFVSLLKTDSFSVFMSYSSLYKYCTLCPHRCGVDRTAGKIGVCQEGSVPHLAWAGLHRGEEPPVSGKNGSGMFFFRGCSLRCQYCQNYQISLDSSFSCPSLSIDDAMLLAKDMVNMGAATLSFVTADHFAPFVATLSERLKSDGFSIPLVMNTSGWISTDSIDMLLPFIDIWLWDTKTRSSKTAAEFCGTSRYAEEERMSFEHLFKEIGDFDLEKDSKGIIVRHLVFPQSLNESADVIRQFAPFKDKCWFSLMKQFTEPLSNKYAPIDIADFDSLEQLIFSLDISNGFIQESADCEHEWIPDFNSDNPFPSDYADTSKVFLDLKHKIH